MPRGGHFEKGTSRAKPDPTLCMVSDCERKALYGTRQSTRGYCGKHKHLTRQEWSKATIESNVDFWARD